MSGDRIGCKVGKSRCTPNRVNPKKKETIMSFIAKTAGAALIAMMGLVAAAAPSFAADTTINVALWDKGGNMTMGTDMGMAMPKAGDMAMATMGVRVSADSAPAGKITFDVTNISNDTIHEMIVAPVTDITKPLPFDKSTQTVVEDEQTHLGEVSELDPGASGALTLTMKPGTYILYCNIPGHYMAGMWTLFTVK